MMNIYTLFKYFYKKVIVIPKCEMVTNSLYKYSENHQQIINNNLIINLWIKKQNKKTFESYYIIFCDFKWFE